MAHVVYHKESFKRLDIYSRTAHSSSYPDERRAKAALTRAVNKGEVVREDFIVSTYDAWVAADPIVETHNLLDPDKKPIPIRRSELGSCVDPATERYHTM